MSSVLPPLSQGAAPKFWKEAPRESNLSDYVSIAAPVTEHDTITRAGDYLRVWRLDGVTFEASSKSEVSEHHESLCNLVRNLAGGEFAVYSHRIQRFITDRLSDAVEPAFSAAFSRRYQDSITDRPFLSKELYFTLLYKPHPSEMARNYGKSSRTLESIREAQTAALAVMREQTTIVERTLRSFNPQLLGIRNVGTDAVPNEFWEAGELFSFLINGVWEKVRYPSGPAWKVLPSSRLTLGSSKLELRHPTRTRYVGMLDVKEFAGTVEPGTLGSLLYEEVEFIETQSYAVLPRRLAMSALRIQRDQLISSNDAVVSQIEAMDHALDGLGDGQFQMGEYSYTLAVFADSVRQAGELAARAAGAVAETCAMQLAPVELLADAAWFNQLPGNFKWRPRKATITSRAFAALACNHNFLRGKRDGNPWGEAVALMRTPSGQPFYLNLHASPPVQDSEGKRLPGNTVLIGQTGSGKTTLLCSVLALTPKYKARPRIVSFSLDHDTEIVLRAIGGKFYSFDRGTPTGINPLQREPTPERMGHWADLVKQCLNSPELPLMPADEAAINLAVRTVAGMDRRLRGFTTIRQNLPRDSSGRSLFDRFGKWCRGGENGWVFDEADDGLLDVLNHHAIGFDYTGVASSPDVHRPIMMELLNVMGDLINGEPLIYHVAEAWKALGDPIFGNFVKVQQKTIRKKNGLGIFDTQEVADLLNNANGRTMIEQSVTKLILPNADATYADYVDGLGLTEAEFEVVKRLGAQGSRRFLCKQGIDSVECEFDLAGQDDMLAVLSATQENVDVLTSVRDEVGDDPSVFLPVFYERVRAARRRR